MGKALQQQQAQGNFAGGEGGEGGASGGGGGGTSLSASERLGQSDLEVQLCK